MKRTDRPSLNPRINVALIEATETEDHLVESGGLDDSKGL